MLKVASSTSTFSFVNIIEICLRDYNFKEHTNRGNLFDIPVPMARNVVIMKLEFGVLTTCGFISTPLISIELNSGTPPSAASAA